MKRLYSQPDSRGMCTPLAMAIDEKGQTVPCPFTSQSQTAPAPASLVVARGLPIQSNNNMYQNNWGPNVAPEIQRAETAQGFSFETRQEGGPIAGGEFGEFFFTVTNNDAAAQSLILGDPTGLLGIQLGIGAKDADVVVTGTYGATTFDVLKNIIAGTAIDLHTINVQSTTTVGALDSTFYTAARVSLGRANINGNAPENQIINFRGMLKPDTFQPSIRESDNFRFIMDNLSGFVIQNMPPGLATTFTFRLRSIGDAYNMRLVGSK